MILARPLLIYWVGDQYASFSGPAQLFLTYQLVSCTAGIANTMLVGMGRVRAVTVYVTIAMVMNLGISIALARPLGVSGVIIGTLVGYGITAPLYIRLVLRELSMSVAEFVTQAILPILPWAAVFAAVVALTAQLVAPTSLIAVALCCVPGTLVYIAGVVRFAMTREERSALFGFLLPASRSR
jgi:O-antigen/teichoic acid export membrane protein